MGRGCFHIRFVVLVLFLINYMLWSRSDVWIRLSKCRTCQLIVLFFRALHWLVDPVFVFSPILILRVLLTTTLIGYSTDLKNDNFIYCSFHFFKNKTSYWGFVLVFNYLYLKFKPTQTMKFSRFCYTYLRIDKLGKYLIKKI